MIVATLTTGLTQTWLDAGIVAAICALFAVVVLRKSTGLLLIAPMQWLGKVSYSLYLVHSIAGFVIIHNLLPHVGRTWAVVIAIVGVLTCAGLLNRWLEQDASSVLRSLLTRARDQVSRRNRRDGAVVAPPT